MCASVEFEDKLTRSLSGRNGSQQLGAHSCPEAGAWRTLNDPTSGGREIPYQKAPQSRTKGNCAVHDGKKEDRKIDERKGSNSIPGSQIADRLHH
jgi:hypothetical protein